MALTQASFIAPGIDLKKGDADLATATGLTKAQLRARWATSEGALIHDVVVKTPFNRTDLEARVGKYYGQVDLRGITLRAANLSGADLQAIDFFGADLTDANFEGADLRKAWLSETDISGAKFDWAKMDGALVDSVLFNSGTRFLGVNLNAINFTLAALLQDAAVTQQRIANLEKTHPKAALFLRVTSDYGRSFRRFFGWVLAIIVLFGLTYWLLPGALTKSGLGNSMYFSVVTFVTLGYGDITPASPFGMLLVVLEVLIGYVMLGLLVAIISKRVVGS